MQPPITHEEGRRDRGEHQQQLWLGLVLLAAVILATWLPRGLALDRFVTPDEDFWLYRSANFYYGLTHLDFASTYQKEHPGVTVMWAGTAGFLMRFPGYRGSGLGQVNAHQLQTYLNEKPKIPPLEILTAGRAILVLAHTLILALSFWFARRSLGLWPSFAGFLLLAFDPFHLALTRILHLDGLLTNLILLSSLAFLSYLQERKRLYLLVSGAAAGLSWLTKSPGFVLIPVVGLLVFWDLWRRALLQKDLPELQTSTSLDGKKINYEDTKGHKGASSRNHKFRNLAFAGLGLQPDQGHALDQGFDYQGSLAGERNHAADVGVLAVDDKSGERASGSLWRAAAHSALPKFVPLVLWGFTGILVFVSLWPAMWKEPAYVLSKVFGEAIGSAEAGHASPVFFNGTITADGDLGLRFFYFYPLVYLWRSTPVVLSGLACALAGFFRKEGPFNRSQPRQAALGLLFVAAAFTVLISMSGKKFDRYLIPAFAPLDLLAGMGWVWLAWKWLKHPSLAQFARLGPAIAVLAIAVQMASALSTFPYYFSYYNPLMGGARKAVEVMQIGWGEGLDQAARYLDQKPDAENLKVISWYSTSCFSYLSKTQARFMGPKGDWTEEDLRLFNTSDYAVVYIHQWQRGMPAEVLARLAGMKPEHSIWINGIEYVRIYKLGKPALTPIPPVQLERTLRRSLCIGAEQAAWLT